MPGLNAIVGRTRKEAEELHHFLQSKIHPDVGLELLSNQLGGFDLSEYDLDGPLPDIPERQFALSGLGNTRNIIRWANCRSGMSGSGPSRSRSEEDMSELQSPDHLVCRLVLEENQHVRRAH